MRDKRSTEKIRFRMRTEDKRHWAVSKSQLVNGPSDVIVVDQRF